ncbi:MAG: hypothetical protein M3371_05310 [Acidobacteriota bacterium]|nr:hypothetical protein [Acidobacteriota bacterium]
MNDTNAPHLLLGLIELDKAGTVLYSRLDKNGARPDINGQNFFSEVAPFNNVEDFRQLIDTFTQGPTQAHCLSFICEFNDCRVPVRVLLARICERSLPERPTKSILIHIREAWAGATAGLQRA